MTKPHRLKLRVYYEDTDAGGIVYHARYLGFAERGRTEMLRDLGFVHAEMFKEQGIGFALRTLSVDYQAPARLDDLLTIESEIVRLGGASMDLVQKVLKGDTLLATLNLRLVCMDTDARAQRIPVALREILEKEN